MRKFSKAKNQKEKIEESTRYEIEKEKLKNINKILKKNYNDLLANENLINSLSESYNITEKNIDERTKEEVANNIENINNILQKKQQELDIATTKSVLIEKFWRVRNKFNIFFDVIGIGMLGALLCTLLYGMPIVYINELENIQNSTGLFSVLAPAIIGNLVCGGYCVKRISHHTSAFKTINNELGDNTLPEFSNYEKDKQIDKDLKNAINETCAVKLKLELEKQKLNNISEATSNLQTHSDAKTV